MLSPRDQSDLGAKILVLVSTSVIMTSVLALALNNWFRSWSRPRFPVLGLDFCLIILASSLALVVWPSLSLLVNALGPGVGYCQCLIAFYVAFYYNVIIAWSVYFLVASLTTRLPWTTCDNDWNTNSCVVRNYSVDPMDRNDNNSTINGTSAAQEYFE